jgi:hypothetical protein
VLSLGMGCTQVMDSTGPTITTDAFRALMGASDKESNFRLTGKWEVCTF